MFYPWCFFFFRWATSELPQPIAVKLCHMIAIWVHFIMQVQNFGGALRQRNWGPKTCKIWRDFRQLQTSIANISRTGQDIQNRKDMWSPAIPPAINGKGPVNFGPLTTENCLCLNPPKLHFSGDYISALRGCWPLKFYHALQIDQVLLAHTPNGDRGPPKNLRANM